MLQAVFLQEKFTTIYVGNLHEVLEVHHIFHSQAFRNHQSFHLTVAHLHLVLKFNKEKTCTFQNILL